MDPAVPGSPPDASPKASAPVSSPSSVHPAGADAGASAAPPRLARSAGVTGAATLASRILGLVRDQVLAAYFGAGNEMDAFIVAFRIPNLVRDLFAEGAMSAAFVPTFTQYLTRRGRDEAWRLGTNVLNGLLLATGVLVLLGIAFAHPIVMALAGHFATVPGKIALTTWLARITLPFLIFVAVAAAMMGMLNSLHHFFVPALSPAMFNIALIACTIGLVPVMPMLGLPRITAIAIGALLGGLGQIALQWPVLRREGYRYRPRLEIRDEGLRQVLVLMGPGLVGLAALQINLFVTTLLATTQGTGAVSWLNYGFRLAHLPIGLFGVSIATAVLPSVSRHAAQGHAAGVRRTVADGLGMMFVLNIPATFGLLALAPSIVGLVFQRGRFTAADTAATAAVLRCYAVGLVGFSAVRIVSPTFYALHRSRVPVMVSVGAVALNLLLCLTLLPSLGYRALALGPSLAAIANAGTLVFLLSRQLDGLEGRRLTATLVRVVLASALMAAVAAAANGWLGRLLPGGGLGAGLLKVGGAIAAGLVVLVVSVRALGIREFDRAVETIRARLGRAPEGAR
ncbi:MAG TPA: murein biosynthesis integral membrane protein MurJ [Vicinamibacterales bacterium]|nr:murein biosynthesis integral membrane protein MurJ [Vicinamibacterales bacterium]